MPNVSFIGKTIVDQIHTTLPPRALVTRAGKGLGTGHGVDQGNLVVHGDNLASLHALLPLHAGAIDCIYGDPPYNTGNSGWLYNDNVSTPLLDAWFEETGIRQALQGSKVHAKDPQRHDKWMAMMWPRLRLMHALLSPQGAVFLSIDDDEHHMLRAMCDEIFGRRNFVASVVWEKKATRTNDARHLSDSHDYVLIYAKSKEHFRPKRLPRTPEADAHYTNPDHDPEGPWQTFPRHAKSGSNTAPFTFPNGITWAPPKGTYRRLTDAEMLRSYEDGRIVFPKGGKGTPRRKKYLHEMDDLVPTTLWTKEEVGTNSTARGEIKGVFSGQDALFDTPKPLSLLTRIVQMATGPDSIVLDPFAGSGTTGHAVWEVNQQDGGRRRFVLLECESYADTITAERLRRVAQGVSGMKDGRFSQGYPGVGFAFAALES